MKIYNAKIYTLNELRQVIENGWVEIKNGKITAVSEGETAAESGDIDAKGFALYPGFIDAHTHLGLTTNGVGIESEDFNEESQPCSAQLRVMDAVNPFDESFKKAREVGITSVLISPGSMNPVAGDIIAVSTLGKRIDDMIYRRAGIKFALGENPKMTYLNRDETPCTRMATAAIIREALAKAKRYMSDKEHSSADDEMPETDLKSEALMPLLNGKIKAHFHCHRADDIFTAIRISKEFSLDCVLIHCTDGHLIADELAKENVTAVIGPIICDACKPELLNITPKNAAVLSESGVKICICTDHSETPIEYLPITVGIAMKHGLSFEAALEAVTINAAEAGGIDDIAGSVEVGKRADLCVFDGSPFEIMSDPKLVIIGGKTVKDKLR
ncbi:MAG: amidohydrolase [Ruminococcus sp.]|nr:amidohydrolase [Ruminococcus sp.]